MSVLAANAHIIICRESTTASALLQHHLIHHHHQQQQQQLQSNVWCCFDGIEYKKGNLMKKRRRKREVRVHGFWPDLSRPTSVQMEPITDCDHLDQILEQANQVSQPIIIDWMAAWCRKCIFLKPQLEKLAAEYHKKLIFYFVDVNNVPQALVKRGNISKMPTIQLWKDGEMKEEVIGGHKAWMVVEEVREMIEKHV